MCGIVGIMDIGGKRDIDRAVITSFATWLAGLDPELDDEARSEIRGSVRLMSVPEQRTMLLKHEAKVSIGGRAFRRGRSSGSSISSTGRQTSARRWKVQGWDWRSSRILWKTIRGVSGWNLRREKAVRFSLLSKRSGAT